MSSDRDSKTPKVEPEIIPPGQDDRASRRASGIWMRVEQRDGVRRVYLARPSIPSILVGLLVISIVGALAFLAMAGLLIVWMPILIGGVALAFLSTAIRRHWYRLRTWWGGGSNLPQK
jgi:hypothetical protein